VREVVRAQLAGGTSLEALSGDLDAIKFKSSMEVFRITASIIRKTADELQAG
jgi:hypothetical protein